MHVGVCAHHVTVYLLHDLIVLHTHIAHTWGLACTQGSCDMNALSRSPVAAVVCQNPRSGGGLQWDMGSAVQMAKGSKRSTATGGLFACQPWFGCQRQCVLQHPAP